MTNYTKRARFTHIIGYTEKDFIPHYTTTFSMKLCHKVFIECFSVLRVLSELLEEDQGLGAHTGVVVLSPSVGVRYFWCNKSLRPCGDIVPLQCPNCFALRVLRFSSAGPGRYKAKCHCQWEQEYSPTITSAIFPVSGNGWAREMLYGGEADFQRVLSAPRNTYNIPL